MAESNVSMSFVQQTGYASNMVERKRKRYLDPESLDEQNLPKKKKLNTILVFQHQAKLNSLSLIVQITESIRRLKLTDEKESANAIEETDIDSKSMAKKPKKTTLAKVPNLPPLTSCEKPFTRQVNQDLNKTTAKIIKNRRGENYLTYIKKNVIDASFLMIDKYKGVLLYIVIPRRLFKDINLACARRQTRRSAQILQ